MDENKPLCCTCMKNTITAPMSTHAVSTATLTFVISLAITHDAVRRPGEREGEGRRERERALCTCVLVVSWFLFLFAIQERLLLC